jgi:hypothetical protein
MTFSLARTTVEVSHVAAGEHMVPGPFHFRLRALSGVVVGANFQLKYMYMYICVLLLTLIVFKCNVHSHELGFGIGSRPQLCQKINNS